MKKQIKFLALKGFTDVEISQAVGIDESTLTKWKQKNPKFFMSLKDWKAEADLKVEKCLRDRALGYEISETTERAVPVKDDDGNVIENKMVVSKVVHKHMAPDTTAQIFWLKNRKREEWSDNKDVTITDESKIDTPEETLRRLAFMLRNKQESDGAA
jgi:hypothetical protein